VCGGGKVPWANMRGEREENEEDQKDGGREGRKKEGRR
jgi:hypothetical protein